MGNEELYGHQSFSQHATALGNRQLAFPLPHLGQCGFIERSRCAGTTLALAQVSIRAALGLGVTGRIVPLHGVQKGTGAVEFKQHRLTQGGQC